MKRLTDKMNNLAVKGGVKGMQAKAKLAEVFTQRSGEGFVDTALKILISVVVVRCCWRDCTRCSRTPFCPL